MVAVDTNVLIRMLVADDAEQSAEARRLFARAQHELARVFVSDVVLCETAWVLRTVYRLTADEIAETLATLVMSDLTTFSDDGVVERALHAFRLGEGDFADYLIRESSLAAGAQAVATFDRRALTEPGFVRPDPESWPRDLDVREEAPPYRRRRRAVAPA